MTMTDQWKKIKDNWLIIGAVVLALVFMNLGNIADSSIGYSSNQKAFGGYYAEDSLGSYEMDYARGSYYPTSGDDFAPDVSERKLTKNANLQSEVERGNFQAAHASLKNIVTSSGSFLLSENVRNSGTKKRSQMTGSYSIKVDVEKYDAVIEQLKAIGEVQSFSETTSDITGQYTNTEIALQTEKDRLERYQKIYSEAVTVEDKLNAEDRVFNQERTVKYLEDAMKNMDRKIDYSTVSVSLSEKRSDYANVTLAKFSALIRSAVDSFNGLLYFLFVIAPWAVVALVVWIAVRFFRK